MTECRSCKCGWIVHPAKSVYHPGKWYVMCPKCVLSTKDYATEESAIKAWNHYEYTRTTAMLQKPMKTVKDLDNDGAVNLVEAIYRRAIEDYEEALDHPEIKEYQDKRFATTRKEIEDMYRYGYFTGLSLGDAGVRELRRVIRERAEERERRAEEEEAARAKGKDRPHKKPKKPDSRKKQAS